MGGVGGGRVTRSQIEPPPAGRVGDPDPVAAQQAGVLHALVGQERAVAQLAAALAAPVHAYLFSGPPGSGKRAAARAFAAALLCHAGGCGACGTCMRVLAGVHPDVVVAEREGASITVGTAREIRRLALRTSNEGTSKGGSRKVLVLDEFHLVSSAAASTLLKVIEEPPPGTVFVIIADHVPPELETIASRAVEIEFAALAPARMEALLRAEGTAPEAAALAAGAAGGRLDRARLLAADAGFAARRDTWRTVPRRLDGTGATVAVVAAELLDLLSSAAVEPLKARHGAEKALLEERAERTATRVTGRKELEDRHRRELKRLRTDELRFGLGVMAAAYRDAALRGVTGAQAGGGPFGAMAGCLGAVETIQAAAESLEFNPSELLMVQALLLRLPPLSTEAASGMSVEPLGVPG